MPDLNEAQQKLRAYELKELQRQVAENPDCKFCQELLEKGQYFAPKHQASAACQSGGCAHCTCDTCF